MTAIVSPSKANDDAKSTASAPVGDDEIYQRGLNGGGLKKKIHGAENWKRGRHSLLTTFVKG